MNVHDLVNMATNMNPRDLQAKLKEIAEANGSSMSRHQANNTAKKLHRLANEMTYGDRGTLTYTDPTFREVSDLIEGRKRKKSSRPVITIEGS